MQRVLKILVATSVHLPNDARIVRQLEALSDAGHDCTLLAPWAGTDYSYRFRTAFFQRRPGLGGRLYAHLKFLRAALFQRWDAIHYHDFDLSLAAILVRLLTWQRVVYDVHENYGEEVMFRAYLPPAVRKPLKLVVNTIEWLASHILGRLIVVVPAQMERFTRWGGSKIVMVRNFASASFLPPEPVDHFAVMDGRFVVFTGGQTVKTGAYLLLDTAILLHKLGHAIQVRAIDRFEGSPGLREEVLARIEASAPNYSFLPRVTPQRLGDYLGKTAIGLGLLFDNPCQRIAIPTKLFEYMAYGIPIVATDVGYQGDIVRESGAGILVPPDDPEALAEAIVKLWNDPVLRDTLGKRGRQAFISKYSWESEAKKLVQFYAEV